MAMTRPRPALSSYRAEPEDITKAEMINRLRRLQEDGTISWVLAGPRLFEWGEINLEKEKFLREFQRGARGIVTMSVHVPGRGSAYSSFRITG